MAEDKNGLILLKSEDWMAAKARLTGGGGVVGYLPAKVFPAQQADSALR